MYFIHHPSDFIGRAAQVSIWSGPHPFADLLRSAVRTALMFNIRGDGSWRHNLRNSPELLWPVGIFFLVGFWVALRNRSRVEHRTLVFWLLLLLVPAVLTRESVPHAFRSIGALPAAVMLAAIGADFLLARLSGRRIAVVALLSIALLSGAADLYRYFLVWARRPEVDQAFMYPNLQVSKEVKALPRSTRVLVVIGDPPADIAPASFKHQNPDGTTVWLPEQAQIPIYITDNRPNTSYLLASEVGANAARSIGCPLASIRTAQLSATAVLTPISGCQYTTFLTLLQ